MIVEGFGSGPLGVNCYIAVDEKTKKGFMVDPGGYVEDIETFIKVNEIQIVYIILTHGHGDHTGGVKRFMELYGDAKLVACKDEAEMLKNSYENFSVETYGEPLSLTADVLVGDGDTLTVGDLVLTFIHTPGHTTGGMSIYVENCLFSGDTLFAQSIGRTDFPGGSFPQIIDSITKKLFLLPDDTQVYPGHMGPTTIGFEKRNNPFV
ncbi:MAG: MBL fold metallo-hydrolase [Anaerovorax sp.]